MLSSQQDGCRQKRRVHAAEHQSPVAVTAAGPPQESARRSLQEVVQVQSFRKRGWEACRKVSQGSAFAWRPCVCSMRCISPLLASRPPTYRQQHADEHDVHYKVARGAHLQASSAEGRMQSAGEQQTMLACLAGSSVSTTPAAHAAWACWRRVHPQDSCPAPSAAPAGQPTFVTRPLSRMLLVCSSFVTLSILSSTCQVAQTGRGGSAFTPSLALAGSPRAGGPAPSACSQCMHAPHRCAGPAGHGLWLGNACKLSSTWPLL